MRKKGTMINNANAVSQGLKNNETPVGTMKGNTIQAFRVKTAQNIIIEIEDSLE